MLLHTKYQDNWPCGFRQEDFFHVFPIYTYVHVIPGAGPFLTAGVLFEHAW